jgi:hypothetical protein
LLTSCLPLWHAGTQRTRDRTPSLTSSPKRSMTRFSEIAAGGDTPVSPTSSVKSRPDTRSKKAVELVRIAIHL